MPINDEGMLGSNQAKTILQKIIDAGRAGLFSWDIDNHEFVFTEKITGRDFGKIDSLEEFLHKIVFEKDIELALQDLENFMTGKKEVYESTFRILDTENNIRWILCKGSMISDSIMSTMMYDLSERNLLKAHDHTTNLINQNTFLRKLKNSIHYSKRSGKKGALLYIGIDNFNTVLNKYGIDLSGSILYKVSRHLLNFVGEKDELASFPYNKFMLHLDNIHELDQVERIAKKITTMFESPILVDGQYIYLNINIGITFYPEVSTDIDELMRICNFAISHSRKSGSHAAIFTDSSLFASYNRDMEIENELPTALLNEEMFLVFQPQLNIKTNKISGVEVLLRWENKNIGKVSPADFIPVAEEKGFIVSIGRWIREESIKTARKWLDEGITFEKISINISSIEIFQRDFKDHLLALCHQFNIKPQMIELEITERTFMNTEGNQRNVVSELSKEGFKISLDDFGTGYSNLRSLLEFNIHTLKLDKSLIDKITDPRMNYLLRGILSTERYLYTTILAEGVEDEKTAAILSDLGFDTIQGYYFSKPLPTNEVEAFITDFNAGKME